MVTWLLAGGAVVLYLANKDKTADFNPDAVRPLPAGGKADAISGGVLGGVDLAHAPHSPTYRLPAPAPGGAAGVAAAAGVAGLAAATHQQQDQAVNIMPAPRPPTYVPPRSWGLEGKGMALNNVSRSLYP